MGLRGQARTAERGYALAALLVMMAVLAVLMSVAMPVWRRQAVREKETELVWRGQQYVRAIRLFQAKTQALPPSVDALVSGRYLRKKFKDPITNDDFVVLSAGSPVPGQTAGAGGPPASVQQSSIAVGGIMGVASKSKLESVRIYQGRTHYNEWQFLFVNQRAGAQVPRGTDQGIPQRGGRGFNEGGQAQPGGGRGRSSGTPQVQFPGRGRQ